MIEEPPKLTVHRGVRRPEAAQVAAFQGVTTGNVVDAMEGRGALAPTIRPLFPGQGQIAGPAMTAGNGPGDILATLAAIAFVQPGDLLVAGTSGHQGCAAAGDRVAGMARNAGAVAMITDGPVRDGEGIAASGLPVWCTGLNPGSPFTTGPGNVGGALDFAGGRIAAGDIVVADADGVVVVPFEQIDRTIEALARVAEAEAELDAKVAQGLQVSPKVQEILESADTPLC